jgi:carbon monoxide dehydrogenase subunit G
MLHFEGDTDFPQAPASVWAKMSDARFLVQCLPGVEKVSHVEASTATCILRPGLSFVRGTLEITIRLTDVVEGKSLRVLTHGKGIGSSNDVESTLTFAAHDGGTRIHWTADVTHLGGLIKAVPQGLLSGAAQKVIADVWATIKTKLGA